MSIFSKIPKPRVKRSKFNLSHDVKMSIGMGKYIPFLCEEVLPGDKYQCRVEAIARMAPMLAPIMHKVDVYYDYFFVPNRLVWSGWEDFITGGKDGNLAPSLPFINPANWVSAGGNAAHRDYVFGKSNLADYLGIPPFSNSADIPNVAISQLPFRAYSLIWNDYLRDQTLDPEINIRKDESGEYPYSAFNYASSPLSIRSRRWRKDYFTSALPWTQRGPEVNIPNTLAGSTVELRGIPRPQGMFRTADGTPLGIANARTYVASAKGATDATIVLEDEDSSETPGLVYDPMGTLVTPSTSAQITLNSFRRAHRLQQWLERNARGGARYAEQILSHFGVIPSDARLQRPEYLGGGRGPLLVSEVLQTSSTDSTSPQANMAGHGISAGVVPNIRKRFNEHGHIIGVVSVLPRAAYQDGINKSFLRRDKLDFFFPEFANLGEQPIDMVELYAYGQVPGTTFGYTPRYAEYKYRSDRVSGSFRDTLSFWHLGRIFKKPSEGGSPPSLNAQFIESDPTNRIFAVQDLTDEQVYMLIRNDIRASRPMPYFGTPTL